MPNPRRGSTDSRTSTVPTKRYRSACDMCHQTKIKCTGGPQCDECIKLGVTCRFSTSDRIGRPKGARNKSTLERIRNYEAQASAGDSTRQTAQEDVPSSNTGTNVFGDLQDMDALDLFQSPWLNTNAFYENETENENSGQRNHYNDQHMLGSMNQNIGGMMPSFAPHFQHLSLLQGNDHNASWATSPDPASASPSTPGLIGCSCLSNMTELLCQIKTLDKKQPLMPVDILLVCANQVLDSSAQMLTCMLCLESKDQEVLLLSAVNTRLVMRKFYEVLKRMDGNRSFEDHASGGLAKTTQGGETSNLIIGEFVRIGNCKVTGSDGQMVRDFVLLRTFSKFKIMLGKLRDRCAVRSSGSLHSTSSAHKQSMYDDASVAMTLGLHDPQDADHLKALLGNIESTVDMLSQRLKIDRGVI